MSNRIDLEIHLDDEGSFEEADFEKELGIDLDNLPNEIRRHGGRYWRYGKLHAAAIRVVSELRADISVRERGLKPLLAELNDKHRAELAEEAESSDPKFKVTEKMIEAAVLQDPSYIKALEKIDALNVELIDAQYTENILGVAEKLFSARTDLLRTLGHMIRAENESDGMSIHSRREAARSKTKELEGGMRSAIKRSRRNS